MTDQLPADLARFKELLPYTLKQEMNVYTGTAADWSNPKNFDDDPRDPGGATQGGITQGEYDIDRKHAGEHVQSVKLITQAEGEDIYDHSYYLPYCPLLPAGLDLQFFDSSVNEGTHEAVKILQTVLGIDSDGAWGDETATAVKAIKDPIAIVQAFTARRAAVYKETRGDQYFDIDWQRRDKEIGAAALDMATDAFAPKPAPTPPPAPTAANPARTAIDALNDLNAVRAAMQDWINVNETFFAKFVPASDIDALANVAMVALNKQRAAS